MSKRSVPVDWRLFADLTHKEHGVHLPDAILVDADDVGTLPSDDAIEEAINRSVGNCASCTVQQQGNASPFTREFRLTAADPSGKPVVAWASVAMQTMPPK
jgi:hypothetical protein